MSGVGKGVATSSLGAILQSRKFKVTAVKIDPYINIDAGTMNPVEHGEIFVTKDGMECDQDIGNYERFLNQDCSKDNYMTTGSVYLSVIQKERGLKYNGKSVEVVPHIPLEVIERLENLEKKGKYDFILVEIGGTVGEYQNVLFLEAIRILKLRRPKDVMTILVSYAPILKMTGEMKTKPTQYASRTLNASGVQPDIILVRSEEILDDVRKEKIATFCNVHHDFIVSAPDILSSIYEIPINFEREDLAKIILEFFEIKDKKPNLTEWNKIVKKINSVKQEVRIGLVGKYFESGKFTLADSYISVIEALKHASWEHDIKINMEWINSEDFEKDSSKLESIKEYDGIVVLGAFGSRGTEGKIKVAGYCRENKIPYLGLCYGMQIAVIELLRNVCGLSAHTTETDPKTKHPVVDVMAAQKENIQNGNYGASMRLGGYDCKIKTGTLAKKIYKKSAINERHRHRYEINDAYQKQLEESGCIISGINPQTNLIEIIELKDHPFFIGTQFHPELQSRFMDPHPIFLAFIKSAKK